MGTGENFLCGRGLNFFNLFYLLYFIKLVKYIFNLKLTSAFVDLVQRNKRNELNLVFLIILKSFSRRGRGLIERGERVKSESFVNM